MSRNQSVPPEAKHTSFPYRYSSIFDTSPHSGSSLMGCTGAAYPTPEIPKLRESGMKKRHQKHRAAGKAGTKKGATVQTDTGPSHPISNNREKNFYRLSPIIPHTSISLLRDL